MPDQCGNGVLPLLQRALGALIGPAPQKGPVVLAAEHSGDLVITEQPDPIDARQPHRCQRIPLGGRGSRGAGLQERRFGAVPDRGAPAAGAEDQVRVPLQQPLLGRIGWRGRRANAVVDQRLARRVCVLYGNRYILFDRFP